MKHLLFLSMLMPAPVLAKGSAPVQLWQEWYLITQNGAAVGYFEETAERRPGDKQVAITQKWVEKADGLAETYIGSVAEEARLKPVAFFVERKAASEDKSYKTDARVKDKKIEITFKPASAALAKSTEVTNLTADTFLSSFMGMAVARNFKGTKPVAFTAVVEDGGDMNVEIKKGTVELSSREKKFGSDNCRAALVEFNGKTQEWWVTKAGKTCEVLIPSSSVKMALSSEAAAKKAVGGK